MPWLSRWGLIVSFLLLFGLQALLPLTLSGFGVDLLKWVLMQTFSFGILVLLLWRLGQFGENSNQRGGQSENVDAGLSEPDIIDTDLLVGAVVHEIRTPLNKLKLLVDRGTDPETIDQLERTLAELRETVDRVEEVFRNRSPQAIWVSTVAFVADLEQAIGGEANVAYEIGTSWLYFDPGKMKLTLENLIDNSREAYDHEKGPINVSFESVGPEWCITVSDSAGGMDPDKARVISSQSSEGTAQSGGMGLGLMISRRVVENHNGRMIVESEPNYGTEITVTLPKPGDRTREEAVL